MQLFPRIRRSRSVAADSITVDRARQDFLRECASFNPTRLSGYATYEAYYEGEHRTQLIDRAKQYLEASGITFAENFCETVVDVQAERLNVTGFACDDSAAYADWARDRWQRNRADELQGVVHTNTTMKGDGFVCVDYSAAKGRCQFTWNRPEIIEPHYADESDVMEYLVKCWDTSIKAVTNPEGRAVRRMNIYYPDRVEKWFATAKGSNASWAPHIDYSDVDGTTGNATWPIIWTTTGDASGEPLGIPVFHARNKPKGQQWGRSEIRGAIPMNDALNKALIDLFYIMDAQGWPQRWGTGISDEVSLSVAIGEFMTAPSDGARFGQFDPASPEGALAAIAAQLQRMAARTRTPLFMLAMTGTLPSGEALKTAESPLVKKVEDRQVTLGNLWEDVMAMGYRLEQTFGAEGVPAVEDPSSLQTQWANAATRDEAAFHTQLETDQRLGASKHTTLEKAGYDPEVEKERREAEANDIGDALMRNFDRGNALDGELA